MTELYGGTDPRDIPAYSISDAARYLHIPAGTIRSWTVGRKYPTANGSSFFSPLIQIRASKPRLLSFTNLVEIHVLRAIRQHHQIDLGKVRDALDFIDEQFQAPHPLARESFFTDGVDLFIERYGSLIHASKSEQSELKASFNAHLERIEPDDTGLAIKLYPFTRSRVEESPKLVVIDPRVAFGRLVIAGTGIAARVLLERYRAGDTIEHLARDYNCDYEMIDEAIRCEVSAAA